MVGFRRRSGFLVAAVAGFSLVSLRASAITVMTDSDAASVARATSSVTCPTPSAAVAAVTSRSSTGQVQATVPPVVFVHRQPHSVLVSTNTGRPPRPQDTFYDVTRGRTLSAHSPLGREVLGACGASR
jgi:hypothetical protein